MTSRLLPALRSPLAVALYAPVIAAFVSIAGFWILLGFGAASSIMLLIGAEGSFGLDNAIIDAGILVKMKPGWRLLYLTVGIGVGILFMRYLAPIYLVSLARDVPFGAMWQLALHSHEAFRVMAESATPLIVALVAPYLVLSSLTWALDPEKEEHWHLWGFKHVEEWVHRKFSGNREFAALLVVLTAIVVVCGFVAHDFRALLFALISVVFFCLMHALEKRDRSTARLSLASGTTTKSAGFLAGLALFIRLELTDASLSLDSLSLGLAITKDILALVVGLGVGMLFVRSFIKLAVQHGILAKYIFLDHGARWSLLFLGIIMPLSLVVPIPEYVTGLITISLVAAAFITSVIHQRSSVTAA